MNVQEPPTTRSDGHNPNIPLVPSDPERIQRINTSTSLCTVYTSPRLKGKDKQYELEMLSSALESENEGPLYLRVQEQNPTSAPLSAVLELLNRPRLRVMMQQMAREEAKRI